MYTKHSSAAPNSQELETTQMLSTVEWAHKLKYIYTLEYNHASQGNILRNESLYEHRKCIYTNLGGIASWSWAAKLYSMLLHWLL